jgi:hypothetical protein
MKDTPAFPVCDAARIHELQGMTLRDYFAAKALQGILSDSYDYSDRDRIATKAYEFADAMLKAREQ